MALVEWFVKFFNFRGSLWTIVKGNYLIKLNLTGRENLHTDIVDAAYKGNFLWQADSRLRLIRRKTRSNGRS